MNVLCLFDYNARTGFARVSENIIPHLKKHFKGNLKLDICAINYFGESYQEDENTFVFSARLNDPDEDPFGRKFFLKRLSDYDYDGIFIILDSGGIVPIVQHLRYIKQEKKKRNTKLFKSILYFPVDCGMIPELLEGIEFFDKVITYTEYGRNVIYQHRPELKGKIEVIPHGINKKEFFPIKEIRDSRIAYFGENADKFIFTNVSRNQFRKDIPTTIFAYIELRKLWKAHNKSVAISNELPEPFLYLHCHPEDPLGWNIRAIFLQTDLVEDVHYKLLPKVHEKEMVDDEMLNMIYNASDALLTTTLGEGWGFIYSEAAATRKPIIAPYSTSFVEMSGYGKNGYMCETIIPFCSMQDNLIREQVDYIEVAEKMLECMSDSVHNHNKIQGMIDRNQKWVEAIEWSTLSVKWIEKFKAY